MDISLLNHTCLRLKGKKVIFIIDPSLPMAKANADAILITGAVFDTSKVVDYRVVVNGAGDYEIAGVKINGHKIENGSVYRLSIDNLSVIAGKASDISKLGEKVGTSDIIMLNTTNDFNESQITSLSPKIVVIYGDNKDNCAKKLGIQNLSTVDKLSITKDKLPQDLQVIVLR